MERNPEEKTVTVHIATNDFIALRQSNYKLCLAKNINRQFNVIWTSVSLTSKTITFRWTAEYCRFGAGSFRDHGKVARQTEENPISLGETVKLDKDGTIHAAVTGGPKNALIMENRFSSIHPAVMQNLAIGQDEPQRRTAYMPPFASVPGISTLVPSDQVRIWFEQDALEGQMNGFSALENSESDSNHKELWEWIDDLKFCG